MYPSEPEHYTEILEAILAEMRRCRKELRWGKHRKDRTTRGQEDLLALGDLMRIVARDRHRLLGI